VLALVFFLMIYMIFGQRISIFGGETFDILQMAGTPLSIFEIAALSLLRWFMYGGFGYHIYHQLRTISEIYARWTVINIWDTRPLYALPLHTWRSRLRVEGNFFRILVACQEICHEYNL
jgi:hypothetical protein